MKRREPAPGKETGSQSSSTSDMQIVPLPGMPEPLPDTINIAWSFEARQVLEQVARGGAVIDADELRTLMTPGRPKNGNIVGSVFAKAHRDGLITPIGTCQSRRQGRNGSLIRVWRGVQR